MGSFDILRLDERCQRLVAVAGSALSSQVRVVGAQQNAVPELASV